jgi:hypothetical protein
MLEHDSPTVRIISPIIRIVHAGAHNGGAVLLCLRFVLGNSHGTAVTPSKSADSELVIRFRFHRVPIDEGALQNVNGTMA